VIDKGALTEREREILRLIATGASTKDIARQLFISSNTVKVHLRNIFAKIGVSSRTEAAVYAIQAGISNTTDRPTIEPTTNELAPPSPIPPATRKRKPYFLWIPALMIFLSVGIGSFLIFKGQAPTTAIVSTLTTSPIYPSRWQEHAGMPTARSGLALAVYENKIYAIGGETTQGVTGITEQYDPASDSWTMLPSKPVQVADVNAAMIGGQIYIPGGRLASGDMADVLESFDPTRNQWESHSPMPEALSRYALVAFEAKLFIFGGWDGQKYLASVYEYEPDTDTWLIRTPMPTARGFAGAAVAGGRIYVFGGYDGKKALAVNEEYLPDRDSWSQRSPLPAGRYAMGVASIADLIYAIGGTGEKNAILEPLQYSFQQDQWQEFEWPFTKSWTDLGLVAMQTELYGMGGLWNNVPATKNLSYKAIYSITIPIFPNP
jgi:DNA-binding CsgD family transcriptional regulator